MTTPSNRLETGGFFDITKEQKISGLEQTNPRTRTLGLEWDFVSEGGFSMGVETCWSERDARWVLA